MRLITVGRSQRTGIHQFDTPAPVQEADVGGADWIIRIQLDVANADLRNPAKRAWMRLFTSLDGVSWAYIGGAQFQGNSENTEAPSLTLVASKVVGLRARVELDIAEPTNVGFSVDTQARE